MKRMFPMLLGMTVLVVGSVVKAQIGGQDMMGDEGHGYGMVGGYMVWWGLYGLIKVAVVVSGLWLLFRITRAVEKIAASQKTGSE